MKKQKPSHMTGYPGSSFFRIETISAKGILSSVSAALEEESPSIRNGRRARLKRIIFLSVFAFLTLYLIARHSLPTGLSESEPKIALLLNHDNPGAAVAYAQQAIIDETYRRKKEAPQQNAAIASVKQKPADLDSLRALLRRAILQDPLNATAFRLLGQIAQLQNNEKTAHQMMAIASKLSLEEVAAIDFMMRQSIVANNAKEALYYADILMRSDTNAILYVAPIVARMAEISSAREDLITILATDPPWRSQVLGAFPLSGIKEPRVPFGLLIALKKTAHPPNETEVASFIKYLFLYELYPFAYSAWLQLASEEELKQVAYLFNGSFERRPAGVPFDWTIEGTSKTIAGIFARPDDKNQSALLIRFGQARGAFPTIQQTIVLPPGTYRFKGTAMGEVSSRRGLQWRVNCVNGVSAGESQIFVGRFPRWKAFQFDISIPAENCSAQHVELIHMARSPSEELASGYVWFDDLAITRQGSIPITDQDKQQSE